MTAILNQVKKVIEAIIEGIALCREVQGLRTQKQVHQAIHRWKVQNDTVCCGGGCI